MTVTTGNADPLQIGPPFASTYGSATSESGRPSGSWAALGEISSIAQNSAIVAAISGTALRPPEKSREKAQLCYLGHLLTEHRHGLVMDVELTEANGRAERKAALRRARNHWLNHQNRLGGDDRHRPEPLTVPQDRFLSTLLCVPIAHCDCRP